MPQSSLFIWWKSFRRQDDAKPLKNSDAKPLKNTGTKPLKNTDAKPLQNPGTKPLKNTSPVSLSGAGVNVEQGISDKILAISIASAKVSSIAARGVLNVIKAQAGAPTTATFALRIADELRQCTESVAALASRDGQHALKIAKSTAHATQSSQLIIVDLKPVAANISLWAHEVDVSTREAIGEIMDARGKCAHRSLHQRESIVAGLRAVAEVARTIANIVESHVAIARRTTKCVPTVEALTLAIAVAVTESALAVAEAVFIMDHRHPPPYEALG